MAKVIKVEGEEYISAKDMHQWIEKQAGPVKGLALTYSLFMGMIKNSDTVDVRGKY